MLVYFIVWQMNARWEERKIELGKGRQPFWVAPTDGAIHNEITQLQSRGQQLRRDFFLNRKRRILLEMRNTNQTNVPKESLRIECPHKALWGASKFD